VPLTLCDFVPVLNTLVRKHSGVVGWECRSHTFFCTVVTLLEDLDFSFQCLLVTDCENKRSYLHVRASEQYLVLEFGFKLNQGVLGGNGVPKALFSALHSCS